MTALALTVAVLPGSYAVCRLDPDGPIPGWALALRGPVASVTRTADELSIVSEEASVPTGVRQEAGWRALRVAAPHALELVGVLAALTGPLAAAGLPLFSISTFDTDYLLVRAADLDRAVVALTAAGHTVDAPA